VSHLLVTAIAAKIAEDGGPGLSRRDVEALARPAGLALFTDDPRASRFGAETGGVHGGLLYSRSPTRLWHEAPGQLRDVDLRSCYSEISSRLDLYVGRPLILEPGGSTLTLAAAVELARRLADDDGWVIRGGGPITTIANVLVSSTEGAQAAAVTRNTRRTTTIRQKLRACRRSQSSPAGRQPTGARIYTGVVESGVVTAATWAVIQALPPAARAEYSALQAVSISLYPRRLAATNGPAFADLVDRLEADGPTWTAELDPETLEIVQRDRINTGHASFRFPLSEHAGRIRQLRQHARDREGKGSGPEMALKAHANTLYGALTSRHLPTNNFIAANQITAWGRASAFALGQTLNAVQTITDGCSYRRDQIPACSYAECLERMPDYPIRRAEDGDGVPFLDPATIPDDDAGFTAWYREHVRRFFEADDPAFLAVVGVHDLEHKRQGKDGPVAFDGLGCGSCGDYVKCRQRTDGTWEAADVAARGYGRQSRGALKDWLARTYRSDNLSELPPITTDRDLLSLDGAKQAARRVLAAGVPRVILPLGMQMAKVKTYALIRPSAFLFQNPVQRAALIRQIERFAKDHGCGLELLAMRRGYQGRRHGSLVDVAEAVYRHIRGGGRNLRAALNLGKLGEHAELAAHRLAAKRAQQAAALEELSAVIDVRNHDLAHLPTALVVTATDLDDIVPNSEQRDRR
jgi:hypothetical protein